MKDREILRILVKKYIEICHDDVQDERRILWRKHNSLQRTQIPIYIRAFAWKEMPESQLKCQDSFYHTYENFFRQALFRETFKDDFIFEPWVTVNATHVIPSEGLWGLPARWIASDDSRGARQIDPPIKVPEDAKRMVQPRHAIDEKETNREISRLNDAIGDLIAVNVNRAPAYILSNGDISTQLGLLRGIEQVMWDMTDRPAWLHEVLSFMRDGILQTHEEAEKAGDWTLSAHENQAMPYAEELKDPVPNGSGVTRNMLWNFCASQEFTTVGPGMFNKFMLQYQLPIIEKFGLVAYGCCEDLTQKIDVLRQIPNLRRIAVAPAADVVKCAEQIGKDYVLSYRPSPADMVGYGFDPDRIRNTLRRDLHACRECYVDITLKDVETVQNDPGRIRNFVKIAREITEEEKFLSV